MPFMSDCLSRRGGLVRPAGGLRLRALEPVAEFVGGHVDEGVEFAVHFLVLYFFFFAWNGLLE